MLNLKYILGLINNTIIEFNIVTIICKIKHNIFLSNTLEGLMGMFKNKNKSKIGKENNDKHKIVGKKEFEKIFKNGSVKVRQIKKSREYKNFKNIDLAVDYIKNSPDLNTKMYLNRVKVVRESNKIELDTLKPNISFLAIVTLVFSIFTSYIGNITKLTSNTTNLEDSDLALICVFTVVSAFLIAITGIYTLFSIGRVIVVKKNLKYLSYLEKQLEV